MIITQIQPQKKHKKRYNIYTEDGFVCSLSDETIVKNKIKTGYNLSDAQLKQFKEEDTFLYAKELSFRYISRATHTQKQLYNKLCQAGIDNGSAQAAVNMMKEYGYIDDTAYAYAYANVYLKRYSPYVVISRLVAEGIDEQTAKSIVNERYSKDLIKDLFLKYKKKYAALDPPLKKKRICDALARRGYSWSEISDLFTENNEDGEE